MSLADELSAITPTQKGSKCSIGLLLDTLDAADVATLEEKLSDRSYTYSTLSTALNNMGHRVAAQSLSRHHRGVCLCSR